MADRLFTLNQLVMGSRLNDLPMHIFFGPHQRGLVATFLTTLVLGTAFTVSALWSIGLEFVPLVDKGDLLILLVFYAGAFTVGAKIVVGLARLAQASAADSVEDVIYFDIKKKIKSRKHHREYSSDDLSRLAQRVAIRSRRRNWWLYPLGAAFPLAAAWLLLKDQAWSIAGAIADVEGAWFLLGLTVLATFTVGRSVHALRAGYHESRYRYVLALGNVLLLFAAIQAGAVWVAFIRDGAPRLAVALKSRDATVTMSVAMPAINGFLGFIEGEKRASFIPWSEVVIIQTRVSAGTVASEGDLALKQAARRENK